MVIINSKFLNLCLQFYPVIGRYLGYLNNAPASQHWDKNNGIEMYETYLGLAPSKGSLFNCMINLNAVHKFGNKRSHW